MVSDQGTNSITNLNGLSVLTSIGGYLIIGENNALTQHNCSGSIDISKLRQGLFILEISSNELKIKQKLIIK